MSFKNKSVSVDFLGMVKIAFLSSIVSFAVFGVMQLPWSGANAPAWVQAVGSVLAIVIAILIPHWQQCIAQETAENVKKEREIGMASRLYTAILEAKDLVEQVVKQIKDNPDIAVCSSNVALIEKVTDRFFSNFDDDLCRRRIELASRVRRGLVVVINELNSRVGDKAHSFHEDFFLSPERFDDFAKRAKSLLEQASESY